jgi:hypothetical protein
MNRFAYALSVAEGPNQEPLVSIASGFKNAIDQVTAEGGELSEDPAIIVLGSFIAFHVHADVNTAKGYRELLRLCEQRLIDSPEFQ